MPPSKSNESSKPNLRSASTAADARGDNTEVLLDALVKIQESINNGNNCQQETMNIMLQKIDVICEKHDSLHKEVHGEGGLKQQVNELQENLGNQMDSVDELRQENALLKKELNIMRNILIHTTQRVDRNESQIVNLKSKSLSANILIHDVDETEDENLSTKVSQLFSTNLSINNAKFSAIYRMGDTPQTNKPRIICAVLANPEIKGKLISAAQSDSDLGFKITSQFPEEVRDLRSRLYQVRESLQAKEIATKMKGDRLVYKDSGAIYREKIALPNANQLLSAAEPSTAKKLDEFHTVTGDVYRHKGNIIVTQAANVQSYKDINLFSMKVLSRDNALPATSNTLVYSFVDNDGEVHDGYCNDREFGAGQCILRKMNENGYSNKAIIMSRKVGEHLGTKRFSVFQDNVLKALELLDN